METIAEQIQQHDALLSDTQIFTNLVARERLGSTGIGQGIAIPTADWKGWITWLAFC